MIMSKVWLSLASGAAKTFTGFLGYRIAQSVADKIGYRFTDFIFRKFDRLRHTKLRKRKFGKSTSWKKRRR